jgi:acetyl CoA:N6-hydroxylysine acetyl transferase
MSAVTPVNTKIYFMETFVLNRKHRALRDVFSCKKNFSLVYSKFFEGTEFTLSFRQLQIPSDFVFLHKWVNHPSAKTFWQLDGSMKLLEETYSNVLACPYTHSFIGLLNNQPICQADVYIVNHDELHEHVNSTEKDYGIHFLMAPSEKKLHNLSVCCMQTCLSFLFSFDDVEKIFGEPDARNIKANELVLKTGFKFLGSINMSYKTANLYCFTKKEFNKQHLYSLRF